jgi:hypothetical protein
MPKQPVDFSAYPQPEWNKPDSIAAALERVRQAHDDNSSRAACDDLLFAVGNSHAGSYYPVVLAVLPDLESILRIGKPWPQRTVLETLIDLYTSFDSQAGYETFDGVSVSATLRERIVSMKPSVVDVAEESGPASKSARELVECLEKRMA